MCGGIAGALGAMGGKGGKSPWMPGLLFNLGRIASYALLGGFTAVVLGEAGEMLDVPHWARILRLLTAGMILLIGLRFLLDLRVLDRLERAGAGLWRLVQPFAVRLSARHGAGSRLLLGICWGLLPCGLVYSILLTAASTATFNRGFSVMLAFGIGTLPSMLGVTWMSPVLNELLRDRLVKRLVGASLVVLAGWTLLMMKAPMAH
jgi:sulfite exporter TauE/SafE